MLIWKALHKSPQRSHHDPGSCPNAPLNQTVGIRWSGMVRLHLPQQVLLVVFEIPLEILSDQLVQKVMDLLLFLRGQIFHPQVDFPDTGIRPFWSSQAVRWRTVALILLSLGASIAQLATSGYYL